jgi:hypothetical protein
MGRKLTLLAVATAVAMTGAAADASAAITRYVKPGGGVIGPCTSPQIACTYSRVLEGNVGDPGDEVIVLDGDYTIPLDNPLALNKRLDVKAAEGASPTFTYGGDGTALSFPAEAANSTVTGLRLVTTDNDSTAVTNDVPVRLSHLRLHAAGACISSGDGLVVEDSTIESQHSATCVKAAEATNQRYRRLTVDAPNVDGHIAVQFGGQGTAVEDLRVRSRATAVALFKGVTELRRARIDGETIGLAVAPFTTATVSDVVATASGINGEAIIATPAATLRLVNATAVAPGPQGHGIRGWMQQDGYPGGQIDATNTIARGGKTDVRAEAGATVSLDHSNFGSSAGDVEDRGSNQSGDPLFAGEGDFRLLPGSPSIDAGTDVQDMGLTDVEGQPRSLGAAPDIGAHEAPAAPGADPQPQGGSEDPRPGDQRPREPEPRDATAPVFERLTATNPVFAVARAQTVVAAGKRKRGTMFRYALSEAARVIVGIERAQGGRLKGGRCVKATRKNRAAKRCIRYVPAGTLTRTAQAGANELPFSGRIGRKALRPGSYRARFTARDAAGNASAPRSVRFRVVSAGG